MLIWEIFVDVHNPPHARLQMGKSLQIAEGLRQQSLKTCEMLCAHFPVPFHLLNQKK